MAHQLAPKWHFLTLVFGAVLACLVLSCGGGGDDEDEPTAAAPTSTTAPTRTSTTATPSPPASAPDGSQGVVEVTETEFAIEVSDAEVPAGRTTFRVKNAGTIPHNLVVIQSDEGAADLPVENAMVPLDQVSVLERTEDFPGGETVELAVDLPAGNFVLICNVPGHYELGMRSTLEATE